MIHVLWVCLYYASVAPVLARERREASGVRRANTRHIHVEQAAEIMDELPEEKAAEEQAIDEIKQDRLPPPQG